MGTPFLFLGCCGPGSDRLRARFPRTVPVLDPVLLPKRDRKRRWVLALEGTGPKNTGNDNFVLGQLLRTAYCDGCPCTVDHGDGLRACSGCVSFGGFAGISLVAAAVELACRLQNLD